MKKTFNISTILVFLTAMVLFSSCLKDSRYVDFSKVGTLIELPLAEPNAQGAGGEFQTIAPSSPKDTTIQVAVNVASPSPLTTPVTVTLSVTDTTAMGVYNKANATNYKPLPSADYTINGGLTLTVPANQRLAYMSVTFHGGLIGTTNTNYVLPVTIESASQPIAQPYKALLYNVVPQ